MLSSNGDKFISSNIIYLVHIYIFVPGLLGKCYGFSPPEYLVWYVLFIIFVTYSMLPLPLRWSITSGSVTSILHVIITMTVLLQAGEVGFYMKLSQISVISRHKKKKF